ncbi:hypothetical protein C814_01921, partial [Anaerotruncus sp. G3(2012)]
SSFFFSFFYSLEEKVSTFFIPYQGESKCKTFKELKL